jgi:thymidine kinase
MNNSGYLSLIIGPMYSGKTTHLIDLYKKYENDNIPTLVINYAEDTRYHKSLLSTHDKIMIPCFSCYNIEEIMNEFNIHTYKVFLINEGQFFNHLKENVIKLVEKYKKTVHVCGLDGDFRRNGFEQITSLISYSDEIIKKYSICKYCKINTRALFSHRISNETEIKVIGSDNYIPLCRNCYLTYNQNT